MKLNRTGSNWTRLERDKINENWDIIEGSYNDVVGQITDEVVGHLIDSAKLIWKEPVDTVGDLPASAEVGETRMVREADPDRISYVYRYDGEKWEKIQAIDVTLVNEVDRRLTRQLADVMDKTINVEKIIKVPSDFTNLQDAVDEAGKYITQPSGFLNILIESGYKPRSGIRVKYGDYRNIVISSEDAIVKVHDDFSGHFIRADYAHAPILNCLVDMKHKGEIGLSLSHQAQATVLPDGNGIINAGKYGIFVNRLSTLYAHDSDFSGAAEHGMFVDHVGYVYARYINLSNAGHHAVYATKGSIVEVANADLQNAGRNAIHAIYNAIVVGITDPSKSDTHINLSGAGSRGISCRWGSSVTVDNAVMENINGYAIYCTHTSTVDAPQSEIKNVDWAVYATLNSNVNINDSNIVGTSSDVLKVVNGSNINASDCNVDGGKEGFRAESGSDGNLQGTTFKNCVTPIFLTRGSKANANDCEFFGTSGDFDIAYARGSIVNANNTNAIIQRNVNALTNNGIAFK